MTLAPVSAARRRAVIDIGSNSVRLVIFGADRRVPTASLNEKVSANLGKTLQDDGLLPAKAMDVALRGLRRFALLLETIGVEERLVVATAAVRDAANGPQFLDRVRALGLDPVLLSGAEEAAASAQGVLCAFPDADGLVADLGGGSLEIADLAQLDRGAGITLPLGTLRLARLREQNRERAMRKVNAMVQRAAPRGMAAGRPLYLVGGSWRALAQFAMQEIDWPLRSPHGFAMRADGIGHLISVLAHTPAKSLAKLHRISAGRIVSLNDAAVVLGALVRQLRPTWLVTSTMGLREGLVFQRMDPALRRLDPLTADLEDQLGPADGGSMYGPPLFAWGSGGFPNESAETARLRLAAAWLGQTVRQTERAIRRERALELALHERMIGIDAAGRGMVAAALLCFAGERERPAALERLCDPARLDLASRWGAVMRLADKLAVGHARLLDLTELAASGGELRLRLGNRALYNEAAELQHAAAAERMGLVPVVR